MNGPYAVVALRTIDDSAGRNTPDGPWQVYVTDRSHKITSSITGIDTLKAARSHAVDCCWSFGCDHFSIYYGGTLDRRVSVYGSTSGAVRSTIAHVYGDGSSDPYPNDRGGRS